MRIFLFAFFAFFCINNSFAQLVGTWKGKFNGKDAVLTLTDAGSDKFKGTYVSERNNYVVQFDKTDIGIEGRGKDRAAGLSSIFVGTINEKNEMSLIITTNWIDQKVEEKVMLIKQD